MSRIPTHRVAEDTGLAVARLREIVRARRVFRAEPGILDERPEDV